MEKFGISRPPCGRIRIAAFAFARIGGIKAFPLRPSRCRGWKGDIGFRTVQSGPGGFLEYAAADYYIQDAASLLPIRLLQIQPSDIVCDVCSAPGGKATAIAEKLGPEGIVVANEAIRSRVDVLRYSLARTGRANWATSNFDPESLALRCSGLFNKVLVDVPCSGQSLLGKERQAESAFALSHVEHCAQRARRILKSAVRLLAPGGVLVFSTCTFSIEENEAQIEWLQREYPGAWEPVIVPELAAWIHRWPQVATDCGRIAIGVRVVLRRR
jgi:16S rRNA C967 or C1407 C5-methylase (RsmB/RsmF family)